MRRRTKTTKNRIRIVASFGGHMSSRKMSPHLLLLNYCPSKTKTAALFNLIDSVGSIALLGIAHAGAGEFSAGGKQPATKMPPESKRVPRASCTKVTTAPSLSSVNCLFGWPDLVVV